MNDPNNLQRYIDAQENTYQQALKEIKNGRKRSHWMWYIFPQLKGLGGSSTAQYYAIQNYDEAKAYYKHSLLGKRLIEITDAFLHIENKTATEILGSPDDLKLKSCMTLFNAVQDETDIFQSVLDKFYDGDLCRYTMKNIKMTV